MKKESQKALKAKLDEELVKDENVKFKSLIEGELINEAGEIVFEDVDAFPDEIKRFKTKFSTIFAEGVKNQIIDSGIVPIGSVKKDDGEKDVDKIARLQYVEAKKAGYKGTLDEYKSRILSLNS